MTAFAFIGVAVTSATVIIYGEAIPNPVDLIKKFDATFVILFAMIVIFVAQISTNMAANVVSPSNDFSNLNPKRISFSNGFNWHALIALFIAITPVVYGFLRAATTPGGQAENPNLFDTLYKYAWFVTFGIAFVVYYLLMKQRNIKA